MKATSLQGLGPDAPIHAELLAFVATMASHAQAMNVDGLMSLYHPDATALVSEASNGAMQLAEIRRHRNGKLCYLADST